MSLAGLIVAFGILAALMLWIGWPWLRGTPAKTADAVPRQRERLQVYYERVLRNIHDLDEDYAIGKLDQADYAFEREQWAQRGVAALKAMDELDAAHLVASAEVPTLDLDERIEAAIEDAVRTARE